nr:MAG TPA: tegument protein [Caudoviricetes sp.]
MGRLIDADKLKADLEKAISKNEDMDCLDFLRIASVIDAHIDAQPTAYDHDKIVKQLKAEFKKYYGENWNKDPYLVKAIEIVKAGGADDTH